MKKLSEIDDDTLTVTPKGYDGTVMIKKNLGKMMKEERQRQGISQQTLADAAGVSKRAIVYWERGTRKMNVESADKIFKALHISVIIGGQ